MHALRPLLLQIVQLLGVCAVGCAPSGGEEFGNLDSDIPYPFVEPSPEIPTVVDVWWEIVEAEPVAAYVEVGLDDGGPVRVTPARCLDGVCEATLLGLKAGRGYRALAMEVLDDGERRSLPETFVTGFLPSWFPTYDSSDISGVHDGYLVTSVATAYGEASAAVILDADGDPVWWYPGDDSDPLIPRATLSLDRQWVIYLAEREPMGPDDPVSRLVRVRLDGTEVRSVAIPGANHDFVELPDGSIGLVVYEEGSIDGLLAVADQLLELSPDGGLERIWSAWDHAAEWPGNVDPTVDYSWSHANALDFDAETGAYQLGMCALGAIVTIDRDSGAVLSRIGGATSDVAFPGEPTGGFVGQHQFQFLGEHLLVFDNRTPEHYASRAVEYALDREQGTAERVWQHESDPPLYCPIMGDVSRLAGGDTLITWSTAGRVDRVTSDGDVAWQVALGMGAGFGYTTWVPDLAP